MKLETYRWDNPSKDKHPGGRPPAPECQHDDCFSCPYPDCIASEKRVADLAKLDAKRGRDMTGQTNIFDEIIVDNFAGGGGASTGIELESGRPVTIAVNHDPDAILMHKTNHPHTVHYCESVWDIDPRKVCHGRPVGLAWFSPDCKHFSKAKGGKPVDKHIRGLAWIALRWAGTVRPRVIILENVEEFQTWGPVRKGKPVKRKAGETFRKFVSQLEALGYEVQWRELVAADYGAPTIRKRFFLIARCDGLPVVWPERTHAPKDSQEVRSGKCKPWRSAAEIIDWSLPCPSIFASKGEIRERFGLAAQRPLRPNTMRRVARGLDKFVLHCRQPYLVRFAHGMITPALIQYHTEQTEAVRGQMIDAPICTVDAANRYGLMAPTLVKYYGNDQHGQSIREPAHTVTANDREGLCVAHVVKFKGQDLGQHPETPLHTVTTSAGQMGVVQTKIRKADGSLGRWPEVRELLNTYCGYNLGGNEMLLLRIGGADWYIADIGLRMLTPRELYAANGFPPDYIIDRDYKGNHYGKSKQVARCGNAVPPPFAEALVRANLPEWCGAQIGTMDELERMVSAV